MSSPAEAYQVRINLNAILAEKEEERRRRVVYVAGPYRAPYEYQVMENILAARNVAAEIWKMGGVALCPHLNTMLMGGIVEDDAFLSGCLELLWRCDAVLMIGEWGTSTGSMLERDQAIRMGIPVFYDLEEARRWYGAE